MRAKRSVAPGPIGGRAVWVVLVVAIAGLGTLVPLGSATSGSSVPREASGPSSGAPPVVGGLVVSSGPPAAPRPAASTPVSGASLLATVNVTTGGTPTSVTYDGANGYLYTANFGTNDVTIISGSSYSVVGRVDVGDDPFGGVYDPSDSEVYITNSGVTYNVSVISGTSVVASVDVGAHPHAAVYDGANAYVYVVNYGSANVSVISGTSVVGTVDVGLDPLYACYDSANGDVYVSNSGSNNVSVIHGTSLAATILVGSSPLNLACDNASGDVYVVNSGSNNVSVLQGTTFHASVDVGSSPSGIALDNASDEVYVPNTGTDNVSVINGTSVAATIDAPGSPNQALYDPVNGNVYVTDSSARNVTVIRGSVALATISVGTDPHVPSYDAATGDVYVPGYLSSNVSVIGSVPSPYAVTFTESGLSNGTPWELFLGPATTYSTSAGSVAISAPDGTYPYAALPVTGYFTSSAGNVTVANDDPAVSVAYEPLFAVRFDETGLPAGTNWTVDIGPDSNTSATAELTLDEPNGTHAYRIAPVPGFATMWTGNVTVHGQATSVAVTFSEFRYPITFDETGLPSGTPWSVTVAGAPHNATGATITTSEPNGTYPYAVGPIDGFATPMGGNVTVAGNAPTVLVTFEPTYLLRFSETGLPAGTSWSVTIGPATASSTTDTVDLSEPNGSYHYTLGPVPGFTSPGGNVTVDGIPLAVPVAFLAFTFEVNFRESGLAKGTSWSIVLNGTERSSTGDTIGFAEPNGSYDYSVPEVAGYASVGPGNATVAAAKVNVSIRFDLLFSLSFDESGLPDGTSWTVTVTTPGVGVLSKSALSGPIVFAEPNGSYDYQIDPIGGYTTLWHGTGALVGAAATVDVVFAPFTYAISFADPTLPSGTNWSVALLSTSGGGAIEAATSVTRWSDGGATIAFRVSNGSYSFTASAPGYVSQTGTFTVNGTAPGPRSIALVPSPGAPSGPTFLGLPEIEGIGLLAALLVVVAAVAFLLVRRRRAGPPPPVPDGEAPPEPAVSEGDADAPGDS
ncbi:MAG TPA: YncE family protein [Thermoplasmata archaeon]|nr:YncE family protein [Thermoplasmata archaeon]